MARPMARASDAGAPLEIRHPNFERREGGGVGFPADHPREIGELLLHLAQLVRLLPDFRGVLPDVRRVLPDFNGVLADRSFERVNSSSEPALEFPHLTPYCRPLRLHRLDGRAVLLLNLLEQDRHSTRRATG